MNTKINHYDRIVQNTVQITPLALLQEKLARGIPLKIKLGVDPTAPDLHLGHTVVLEKLKDFQDAGHEVIFLIGNFTAHIGDPTGKNKTRPPLSMDDIAHNMQTYFNQVSRVLDRRRLTVRFNADWLSTLSMVDIIQLCSRVTVARIIEREDFAHRLAHHKPISLHEMLYPLLQGYDSVALQADVEIGGTDQTFNLLMGRSLQEQYGQEPQVIITVPLLEGTDGVEKMSKSLNNSISFSDSPDNVYGKIMAISDELMWRYYAILGRLSDADITEKKRLVEAHILHPMQLKKELAHMIVNRYWSQQEADAAQVQFEALFQKKDYSQVNDIVLDTIDVRLPIRLIDLLKHIGSIGTSAEGRRLVEAGAVKIDGQEIRDIGLPIILADGMIIKVGKHRLYRVRI